MEKMEDYKTTDYGLAMWLVYRRVTLLGTLARPTETYKTFVFLKNDSTEEYVHEWESSHREEVVICRRFFMAHNTVKKALKESVNV